MTEDEIAAIKARAEAATPGKWLQDSGEDDLSDIGLIWCEGEIVADTGNSDRPNANAEFIVCARDDIPKLVAEVEAWRAMARQLIDLDTTGLRYYPSEIDKIIDQARALLAGDDSQPAR